jgi:hypothetical protein
MKKFLFMGFLILITACQTATPTPTPVIPPTLMATLPPSPIPATFTPEPTFTPAPSPTPFPRFFTNDFDSEWTGWVILQAGNDAVPNIQNKDGNLILQMDSPYTWLYSLYGAQDYTDVRIDAQYINQALTPAMAGLICRYSEEEGWFEYNLSTDGTYNVLFGRWLSVGVVDYVPITQGSSKEILPSGSVQNFGLACSKTTLSLYINETLFRQVDVSRYDLQQGKVGLAVSSYENSPVVIGFDKVIVSEP